ncbi:hypothetical protein CRENBAI_012949 [Crenichthys baileyi]|uniref:Immunoglobulin domain-containing protein n=1 Tax=Crenichthys baileyi TaxID=28760 RepID=A0AAV9SFI0_9TELE
MFQNLDQLKVLDLSFNMLTNMQQLTYLTLGNIGADVRLGGNRWRCDCNMRGLRRQMAYGSTRGLQAGNIICAFPSTVSGKDLLQLDEEDLKCLGTENNFNVHQDVTVYSGAEILLSCSAQDSEWWTHSGRASVNNHEARLLISDFSEGDTGLYVCVSGEDQVLSVFKLRISNTGGIRKTRSLPRVHSQKSLQETTNWSAGKVTKNLSQSDLALAVCLSIFITFLVAFILGVLARPCINNFWRRVTKKKAPPATNTATSVQQRHYDNQAFSNAEEPEEIEPHRERRVTFSSVEFTEESNVQYYDAVASGDHESIRSNEVFEYQAAEVELHNHQEEKQRDDSISVDLAVERLRNMEFEHIPDPDELEERRSLSSSSDSSQNASEADQTTRDHTMPKSLHLVEDSLQTRADSSIATETEIPKTSMKGKSEFPGSPSLHTNKEYPTGSDVSHDDEELFEFSDSAQSPSVKASNLLDPLTSSVHQVENGYDKKRPGEAPDYPSSSDSSDKEPTQTKIKQKTNKKSKKVALISKLGTHSSSSSSSNSDSEENISFVNVKGGISTEQLLFQKSKTKMYDSDGSWPAVDLRHIPRLKRRLDIKALLPSSDASSSRECEDKPRGHVTKNTQGELKMARLPTNVSQTVSPKPENQKPGFELGQTGIKRPTDIKAPTAYSDSSTSSDSDDETTDNVIKQRKENLLMSKLPTKVSPTIHQKPKNHWPLLNLGKTTEIKKPPSTDSDSSSSSDSDNERKHHGTQKKQEELLISKLTTEVTSQKAENQWPALDLGRITRIKRRLDIKAPTADADSDSSSSSDSGDETTGHVTKQKQEELLMSRLPAKVSPTVRPKPENHWPAPNLGKTTEIKKPLDIKAPSTDSDSSSSSDSDNERQDHMTKQKQDELHISKLPANVTTASQKKEKQWPALDLARITRIKRRLDIKAPKADADSDSSSSSDSEDEGRGHVTKQKQEELLMSRLPAKVSPTAHSKPENRWPALNLGKLTEIKKPLDIKAPSTDSDSSSSSDSDIERKDHVTKQKQEELHISRDPIKTSQTVSQKQGNQWPALDLGRITRIKRRLDIKAPTADADSDSSSSSDSGDETRGHVTKQKQEELLMSRLPAKVSPTVRPKPENRWPAPSLGKTTEIKKPLDIKAPSTDSDSSSSSDSDNERQDHMTKQKQDELHISKLPANVTTPSQMKEKQWPALDLGRITRIKRRLDIKAPTAESSSSSDSEDEARGHVTKQKQEELLMSRLPAKVSPTVRPKPENRWPAPNLGKTTEIKKPLDIKAPSTDSYSSSSSDSDNERQDHMTKQKQDELHISKLPANVTTTSQKKENQWPALDLGRITRIKRSLDIKAPTADADSDSSSSSDSDNERKDHVTKQKQEELHISRDPIKTSQTVSQKQGNQWPSLDLWRIPQFKRHLDIKAPATDLDLSSSSDSEDDTSCLTENRKPRKSDVGHLSIQETTTKRYDPNGRWPTINLQDIPRIKRHLDFKAPSFKSSFSSESENETKEHVMKQKQKELLMSRLPTKISETVSCKPENHWSPPDLGKTTENKPGHQWPALDLGQMPSIKKRLDIKAFIPHQSSLSSNESVDYSMTIDPSLNSDRDRHVDNKAPSPLLHVGLNIRSLGSKKSKSQSSSSDSEDENRDQRAKFRNAISFPSTASEMNFIRSQNVPGTNISFSTKTDHNIILKKYNNISGDLENMPANDSSKSTLEVDAEHQSRWAAKNLGISHFRKRLEITSHGTEQSDLMSPPPSNSPFSSSNESGSGKTQRLNRRVVEIKELRHRGSPPVLENFQVNVATTLKDPDDKFTFSHVVQQRINSNYSLRNSKDLTTPSNQSSHSSSSSDSEDKTKDHSETDLSRGVPRIKRRLNIKAPSPELSNSPPLLSQNENLTKHNAVQSSQASTFLGPTDESLITYKRSIFKSSLPNSSFTSSGSSPTVNYVSNLSQDGSNDRHISLATKTAPNTSLDDIIKRKLRQSRPKTDGDQLGEIKWTGVGHHLPDLSSSKLRGVNVASTSLQQASFSELTSPSNDSASGITDINMLQLGKKSDTTLINTFSSLGPDGESSSSSDIFQNLGNSSQITNETLMAPISDKERKGLNALKVMSEERRNWEADKDLTPLFDVQDGGIFSHSQSGKDIKVFSQQSQIQSPFTSDSKREIDLLLLYGVPRYKRHSSGDSLMEASLPDPVTPQPDD